MKNLEIIILEDLESDYELAMRQLHKTFQNFNVTHTDDKGTFEELLKEKTWDLILSDYSMPSFSGYDAWCLLQEFQPETPLIFLTGVIEEELAGETVLSEAAAFLVKGKLNELPVKIISVLGMEKLNPYIMNFTGDDDNGVDQLIKQSADVLKQNFGPKG